MAGLTGQGGIGLQDRLAVGDAAASRAMSSVSFVWVQTQPCRRTSAEARAAGHSRCCRSSDTEQGVFELEIELVDEAGQDLENEMEFGTGIRLPPVDGRSACKASEKRARTVKRERGFPLC